jgi:hypothetical protein
MKQILIINVNITGNSPQPIRIRELARHWQRSARVTILTMNNFEDHELDLDKNIRVVKTDYSPAGRLLISKNRIAFKQYIESKKTLKRRLRELMRKLWRASIFYRLMFPDKFIFEQGNIMAQARRLQKEGQAFDAVIVSVAPFSLQRLGRGLKKLFPGAALIYDTGDPFYGNTGLALVKPLSTTFARRFERKHLPFFDHIVVPTQALKEHYLHHFGDVLKDTGIQVIEQGYQPFFADVEARHSLHGGALRLLYAGGLYKGLREPFELYKAVREYGAGRISLRIFGNIHPDLLPEENDRFYYGGSINPAELKKEYETCDATVFIDNKSGIQVPGKILELTGVQRPVLFIYDNPASPTMPYLEGYNAAVKCLNKAEDILAALQELTARYPSFNYENTKQNYSWPALAEKYPGVFNP